MKEASDVDLKYKNQNFMIGVLRKNTQGIFTLKLQTFLAVRAEEPANPDTCTKWAQPPADLDSYCAAAHQGDLEASEQTAASRGEVA